MLRLTSHIAFLAAALTVTFTVWWVGLGQALGEIEKSGRSDLRLASDRLFSQLQRYRELLVVLATDPRLLDPATPPAELRAILLRASDLSGALDIVLLDSERHTVASAKNADPGRWIAEPFIDRALSGALGNHHALSRTFDTRGYYFAAPLFSETGPVERVLVAVVDLDRIEAEGRGSTPVVLFTDRLGVTYASNRSELVLMQRGAGLRDASARYSADDLRPFVPFERTNLRDRSIWLVDAGPYVPSRALYLTQEMPVLDLTAEALVDVRPAYVTAGLQATIAAALMAIFGVGLLLADVRRRTLSRANATLEARVEDRTRELRDINAALRVEIRERREAEQALKRAQAELVQVGKLSALGQMSAGISHELNQPLMAIRSFAENAAKFLQLDRTEMARSNLEKIADLAGRMARIIKNLKAFARQESEPATRVDLCKVVRDVVELTEPQLLAQGVRFAIDLPDHPVWVRGGEVRLSQVLINLITNATDAMSDADQKALTVSVEPQAPALTVRDSGPGISDPERIFEPFYSTKTVGDGDGTGLGLSISYGLVQSFGGNIVGENAEGGGALFTVRLQSWQEEKAA